MDPTLKIHTQQLKTGQPHLIEQTLPPSFLQITEQDLVFKSPIHLKGEVYTTDDHLIIHFTAKTEACIPCSLCNETTFIPLQTQEIYHSIPLAELPSTIFDLSDMIREEVILLIPQFIECQGGHCPQRNTLSKLMRNKSTSHNHYPFSEFL
jgi:uncharacterized metal-binding protein YceD (DUF177 family)